MIDVGAIWSAYGGALTTVIGGVGGWYANIARVRLGRERASLSAGQQALATLDRVTQLLHDLMGRIAELMRQRWQSDDALQDLYAQAISARLTIQELDAQAGRAPRAFPPLPPYPYPPTDRQETPDNAPATPATEPDGKEFVTAN